MKPPISYARPLSIAIAAVMLMTGAIPAVASMQTVNGHMFDVAYDDAQLPFGDWQVKVMDSLGLSAIPDFAIPGHYFYVVTGAPTIQVINLNLLGSETWSKSFNFTIMPKSYMVPLSSDATLSATGGGINSITSNGTTANPSNPSFAMSVGWNTLSATIVSPSGQETASSPNQYLAGGATDSQLGFYGSTSGPLQVSIFNEVITPTFAMPSTTVPHCMNLTCMDFQSGEYFQSGYTINLGYSTAFFTPAAVPVPAVVWLFGSGLLGLMGVARRRI